MSERSVYRWGKRRICQKGQSIDGARGAFVRKAIQVNWGNRTRQTEGAILVRKVRPCRRRGRFCQRSVSLGDTQEVHSSE